MAKELIKCDYCSKEFYKDRYKIKKSKKHYCSIECRQKARRNKVKIKCSHCGKEFERIPSDIKKLNFCSIKCRCDFKRKVNIYDIKNDVTEITLLNGKTVLIDTEDLEKIKPYFWYQEHKYIVAKFDNQKIRLHRFIMNCPDDKFIDHINHNQLDNRKCNLNIVTNKENQENRKLNKNNKTGVCGVHFDKRDNKFYASIRHNGKLINLGSYTNLDDAAKARKEAEEKYFSYNQAINQGGRVDV